jgi:hypothetical protein
MPLMVYNDGRFYRDTNRPESVTPIDRLKGSRMTTTVGQMSKEELKEMIEAAIEQKLFEMLGDPDEGLELRESVRDRLLRQRQAVIAGDRGEPFEDVVRQLGLE